MFVVVSAALLASSGCGPKQTGVGVQSATGGTEPPPPVPVESVAAPKQVVTVGGITEYTLENGLRVLLFPDKSQPNVTVNITYFVGSRHEGYGEAGMAHLLEHMVFKGTPTHTDIWKILQERGASFNGTTWYDRTNYYETLPASEENLDFALRLEADRMVNSLISADDLAKEFSVVRNEFEMGENNPGAVLEERMASTAFLWHNYGKSTIGNKSDIERVPAESLRAFYRRYYQPDNAMLVVAGSFEPAAALEVIRQSFGTIPRPTRELAPTYTREPVQDGEREVILRRVGEVGIVGVMYHGVPGAHEDWIALDGAIHTLTDEPSGDLYKALVATGKASRVWGSTYGFAEPGTVQFYAEVPNEKNIDAVTRELISIVEKPRGAKEATIRRFRNRELKNFELAMTKSERIAISLSEWAAMGDWRLLFLHKDRIEKLSADAVNKAAANYFRRSNRTTGLFIPTAKPARAPLPEQPEVAKLVEPYKGGESIAAGEEFDASIENIEKRTERFTLKNGMKVAFLRKKSRGGAATIELTLHAGSLTTLKGKVTAASLLPDMLPRGAGKRSYQDLRDEFDRLKAQVSFSPAGEHDAGTTASVATVGQNVPELIALLGEITQKPTFPAKEFEIIKKERLASLEEAQKEPLQLAIRAMGKAMSPYPKGDVRYARSIAEEIAELKKANVGALKPLHRDLYGASAGTVTIVGDFDPDAVRAALEEKFGSWKAKKQYKRVPSPYRDNLKPDEVIKTPDKKNAFVAVAHTVKLSDRSPEYPAAELGAYILAGSAASRLLDRLRQKEGWSYGAFGGLFASSFEESGAIFAAAITAPENADKVLAATLEEIQLLVEKGVSDKELAEAKKAYLQSYRAKLARDAFIAGELNDALYLGRTLEETAKHHKAIEGLSAEAVNAALKKYLVPKRFAKIRAGDFK